MGLSRRSIEVLLDLVEIKLSYMDISDREDARERVRDDVEPFMDAIKMRGAVADIQSTDGMNWWQRAVMRIADKARNLALALAEKVRSYWQSWEPDKSPERGRDDEGGRER